MPGITGIVSKETKEASDVIVSNMVRPMMHRDWYRVKKISRNNFGIASIALDDRMEIAEKGHITLVMTGDILDQDILSSRMDDVGSNTPRELSISDVLLGLYMQYGVSALCGLNGFYVVCIWDDREKVLTLVNDRYGVLKLYYWTTQDRLMFSSEYKAITQHPSFPARINELALADFLRTDYILDNRTLFEDIQLMPPATIMTFRDGRESSTTYWDYKFSDTLRAELPADHYADILADTVREAVRKRIRSNTCILLTGGLDSRTVAGFIRQCDKDVRVRTATIGHEHCYDVRFARRISDSLDFDHSFIPIGTDYIARYAGEQVWRTEGTVNCYTSWIFAADSFIEGNGINNVMLGFLGDAMCAWNMPYELDTGTADEEAARYIYDSMYNSGYKDSELSGLCKPSLYRNTLDSTFSSIRDCLKKAPAVHLANKSTYLMFQQRQRRFTASHIDLLSAYSNIVDPLADNDVIDFAFSIPVELRHRKAIYQKMIVRHLPELARLPYSRSGIALAPSLYEKGLQRLRRLKNRTLRYAGLGSLVHDYKKYAHYDDWLRDGSRDFALQVLGQDQYLEDLFNMDYVKKLVSDHMGGKSNEFKKICSLITFALWRKQFTDKIQQP